ncbi:hypothetical protein N7491_002439 [Penicillium cf. griseofulvum]|uniref:Myb-like DNA-binding domain-containing protein n=1 Tax=Penicillium cf. griseofulvum TaxID=2972120 RepID=A0A9W9T2J7_9EURO|nr:hypothetical protein N7472_003379 [Penicillium cf. griseofulvum]KAJ5446357.1 hypothetical protein N7491_002439 [Penicillium cf. griseofulvum]KAJ5448099.1 hypothetical protein N7445_002920 [Penicillium cf. griseofulvum]
MEATPSPSPALANVKAKVFTETTKASDEAFLRTLLEGVKVDYEGAAKTLRINKAACRMRFIRLQQKHGFKKVGAKRTPRGKKGTANANNKAAHANKLTTSNEVDVAEDGAKYNTEEATVKEDTED